MFKGNVIHLIKKYAQRLIEMTRHEDTFASAPDLRETYSAEASALKSHVRDARLRPYVAD